MHKQMMVVILILSFAGEALAVNKEEVSEWLNVMTSDRSIRPNAKRKAVREEGGVVVFRALKGKLQAERQKMDKVLKEIKDITKQLKRASSPDASGASCSTSPDLNSLTGRLSQLLSEVSDLDMSETEISSEDEVESLPLVAVKENKVEVQNKYTNLYFDSPCGGVGTVWTDAQLASERMQYVQRHPIPFYQDYP